MEPTAPISAVKSGGKNIAGRVKGHKPAVYIGVAIFGIVLAYYLHKRQQAQDAAPPSPDSATTSADATGQPYYPSDPAAGNATGSYYDPGAYLGTATPADGRFSAADIATLLGAYYPTGQAAAADPIPSAGSDGASILPVTGGGPAAAVDTAAVHTTPPAVVAQAPQAPTGYPFKGPHGWYKVVCASGKGDHAKGRWHFYQNGTEEHVSGTC